MKKPSTGDQQIKVFLLAVVVTVSPSLVSTSFAAAEPRPSERSPVMAEGIAKCNLQNPSTRTRLNRMFEWAAKHEKELKNLDIQAQMKKLEETGRTDKTDLVPFFVDELIIFNEQYKCLWNVLKKEIPDDVNRPMKETKDKAAFVTKITQFLAEIDHHASEIVKGVEKFNSDCAEGEAKAPPKKYEKNGCQEREKKMLGAAVELVVLETIFARNMRFKASEENQSLEQLNEGPQEKVNSLIQKANNSLKGQSPGSTTSNRTRTTS